MRLLAAIALLLVPPFAAAGSIVHVPTASGDIAIYDEPRAGAADTLLLFPGGGGGFGKLEGGKPSSGNFLVRSLPHFVAEGFDIAILGRPNGGTEIGGNERISDSHVDDIARVVEHLKRRGAKRIWLVGTSRGSVSVAAAAVKLKDPAIAGAVMSSSVLVAHRGAAITSVDLSRVKVPTLLYHHERDECAACPPSDVKSAYDALSGARSRQVLMATGGSGPRGDPCGAHHWHGFIGMEHEAVAAIAGWIRGR
mgnify:FL=1